MMSCLFGGNSKCIFHLWLNAISWNRTILHKNQIHTCLVDVFEKYMPLKSQWIFHRINLGEKKKGSSSALIYLELFTRLNLMFLSVSAFLNLTKPRWLFPIE